MLLIVIKYYILLLLFSIIFLLTGKILLSAIKINYEKRYLNLFVELLIGISFWTVLYSFTKSGLRTINLLFIYIIIYSLIIYRYKFISSLHINLIRFKSIWKDILIITLSSIPFYIFDCLLIIKTGTFNFHSPYPDWSIYAKLSEILKVSGHENGGLSFNILYPEQFNGITPYHYFELWLNAIISELSFAPSLITLILITYTLLSTILIIGIYALWENFGKINIYKLIFSFIFLFICGIFINYYKNIDILQAGVEAKISALTLTGRKSNIIYIYLILSTILFFNKNYKLSLLLLAILPIMSIGTLPGIIGGIMLFLFISIFTKLLYIKEIISIFFFYIIYIIIYMVIIKYFGISNFNDHIMDNTYFYEIIKHPFNFQIYKHVIGISFYSMFRFFLYYLPYIILYFLIHAIIKKSDLNKTYNKFILLTFCILISGNIVASLLNGLLNGRQFFENVMLLFSMLIILYVIIFTNIKYQNDKRNINIRFWITISIVTLLTIYNFIYLVQVHKEWGLFNDKNSDKYSDEYILNVNKTLKTQKNNTIGFYLLSDQEIKKSIHDFNYFLYQPGSFIQFQNGYWNLIDLTNPINYNMFLMKYISSNNSNPIISKLKMETIKNSEFNYFMEEQRRKHCFISYEQSQVDFINKFKIRYFFTNNTQINIPELIEQRIERKLIDPKSGEVFYLLTNLPFNKENK